jgi:Sulfotransferase family
VPGLPLPGAAMRQGAARRAAFQEGALRHVRAPVFILSPVRSGSTLLRAVLDEHSQLYAPHELHLKDVRVRLAGPFARRSMAEFGVGVRDLEYMLWDRLMYGLLLRSGKTVFVNKTPTDVFIWPRIAECWPDARFVFLLRHPAAVAASWHEAQVHWTYDQAVDDTLRYVTALEEARRGLPGLTVRYEELTERPEFVVKGICAFLGVPWEPGMLRYRDRGFSPGVGDWSPNIHAGRPLRTAAPPDEVHPRLRDVCRAWGYT